MGMGGGGGGRGRRKMGGMNEINVTPLIDVMLVLLVIFMVTAPLLTTGVQVDLPKVKSAPMQTDDSKMLVIVTADEHVYLGKDEITSAIEDRLKANSRLQEEKELYVQADENVKYGMVLRVMAAARLAGVEKLGMITDPLVVK
jgi:biopolymer transport protein TolR